MKRRHSEREEGGSASGGEARAVSGSERAARSPSTESPLITEGENVDFLEMYGFAWTADGDPQDVAKAVDEVMDASGAREPERDEGAGAHLRETAERREKMRRVEESPGGSGGVQFASSDSDSDDDDGDTITLTFNDAEAFNALLGIADLGDGEEPGMRKAVDYTAYFMEALEELERKYEAVEARGSEMHTKTEYAAMDGMAAHHKSGDEVIDDLERCFGFMDDNGFRRSKQQRAICDIFIRGCLRHIYKEELRTDLIRVFRKFRIRRINNMVMVTMPRRCGKTTITSIFVAAYLLCVPNAKVVVYSISRRTSSMLSAKVLQFLTMMQPDGWHPKIHNQEHIAFVNNAGTWASLASYPAAERISITLCLVPEENTENTAAGKYREGWMAPSARTHTHTHTHTKVSIFFLFSSLCQRHSDLLGGCNACTGAYGRRARAVLRKKIFFFLKKKSRETGERA